MLKIALGCCAKMEELYIIEWLEYYKNLGFSHIFIADNNDDNYKYPLIPIIQSYIDDDFVTVIDYHNAKQPCQQNAYNLIYNMAKNDYDWIAFFDIDEFLALEKNNNISEFLLRPEYQNFNVINIIWKLYSANKQLYYYNKPVQERFIKSDNYISYTIKSIIYCIPENKIIGSCHDPLNSKENLIPWKRCDTLGNARNRSNHGPDIIDTKDNSQYIKNCNNIAYIKHYWSKSLEEWIKYKTFRGDSGKNYKNNEKYRYRVSRFFSFSNKKLRNLDSLKLIKKILKNYGYTE